MMEIPFFDIIEIVKSDEFQFVQSGIAIGGDSKDNLCTRAYELLQNEYGIPNVRIHLRKQIPIGAGLGGGSMNAANILNYFVKKNIIKADKYELLKISRLIGSDVILGFNSTNSILNSNNEIKYFNNCKKFHLLIVKPEFGCSTKEIYSKVKRIDKPRLNNPNKRMFNPNYLKKMTNSLEPIAFSKYSKLKAIKFFLEKFSDPVFVRMTGSGSAMVAYFMSKQRCDYAKKQFNKKYKNYWCIASKTI